VPVPDATEPAIPTPPASQPVQPTRDSAEPAAPPPAVPPPISEPPLPPPVTYAGPPRDGDDGNSGVSGLVFVAFLGLGVLALLGGAILGGVFEGPGAEATPTPSLVAEATPTPEPTPTPSVGPSVAPTAAAPTPTPAVTPPPAADGFIARAEPCDDQPSASTCDNSGAENSGDVWILVSFRHAQPTDVIGVTVRDESGATVEEGSIPLNFCGTNTDCAGYTYFFFSSLADGDYTVRATRNGTEVATTGFTVT
jgi:hypothetical protein